ncbi:MAG: hypothetical protein AAB863_03130, partial [Patescibacteria group bacterium]
MEKAVFNLIEKVARIWGPDSAFTIFINTFWFLGGISIISFLLFLYKTFRYFWLKKSDNQYPTRGIWISLAIFL